MIFFVYPDARCSKSSQILHQLRKHYLLLAPESSLISTITTAQHLSCAVNLLKSFELSVNSPLVIVIIDKEHVYSISECTASRRTSSVGIKTFA